MTITGATEQKSYATRGKIDFKFSESIETVWVIICTNVPELIDYPWTQPKRECPIFYGNGEIAFNEWLPVLSNGNENRSGI